MKQLLILFFTMNALTLFAQPGYMGKKISIGYQFEITPFYNQVTAVQSYYNYSYKANEPLISVVTGHHVDLGYVINRKTEIIAHASLRQMTYYSDQLKISNSYSTFESTDLTIDAKEIGFDFGFRHYFRNYVAPAGTYHQLTVGSNSAQFADNVKSMRVSAVDQYGPATSSTATVQVSNSKVTITRLTYGIGTKRIVGDRFYIGFQGNIHFTLNPPSKYYTYNSDSPSNKVDSAAEYPTAFLTRNFTSFKRYSFLFGFGILL